MGCSTVTTYPFFNYQEGPSVLRTWTPSQAANSDSCSRGTLPKSWGGLKEGPKETLVVSLLESTSTCAMLSSPSDDGGSAALTNDVDPTATDEGLPHLTFNMGLDLHVPLRSQSPTEPLPSMTLSPIHFLSFQIQPMNWWIHVKFCGIPRTTPHSHPSPRLSFLVTGPSPLDPVLDISNITGKPK